MPMVAIDEWTLTLERLVSQDCLVSLNALVKPKADQEQNHINWLAISATGRSEALKRAVDSYVANFRASGRRCALIISDDSGSASDNSNSLKVLSSIDRGPLTGIYCAGFTEKMTFVDQIVKKGDIPHEVAMFALLGSANSSGSRAANRNAMLFHTLGSSLLAVDDATVCAPRRAVGSSDKVVLGGHGDPAEVWCFSGLDEALAFGEPQCIDIIAEHEKYLGKQMGHLISGLIQKGGQIDLDGMCSHLLSSLASSAGVVRATISGTRGDNGFESDLPLISHRSQSTRKRIQDLGRSYLDTLDSRQIARQVPCCTVSHWGPRIGMCAGFDNRSPLPPFTPLCETEDTVFSTILGRSSDNDYFAHLPFTLAHIPAEVNDSRSPNRDVKFTVSDVLIGCVSTWRPQPGCDSSLDRIQKIGCYLHQLAHLPDHDFDDLANMMIGAQLCATIERLEGMLVTDNFMPRHWAEDINKRIAALRSCTDNPDYFVPVDLPGRPDEPARRRLATEVGRYGQLLEFWPAIMEGVYRLREDGIVLGRRIDAR